MRLRDLVRPGAVAALAIGIAFLGAGCRSHRADDARSGPETIYARAQKAMKNSSYGEAIKQLERAVSLDGNDATINDHLGDAYWRAGRQIEARSQWEKAVRLSDDKTLTEQIRIKLKDGLDNVENPPRRASVN